MKIDRWILQLLSGSAVIITFIVLLLAPQITDLRARQMDLLILETRERIALYADTTNVESEELLHILCREEFFVSLANIRAAAQRYGLEVSAFNASDIDNFGAGVIETVVRITLTGCFDQAVDYVNYLVAGVYNVRFLSLVNTEATSFEVLFSIFHEKGV